MRCCILWTYAESLKCLSCLSIKCLYHFIKANNNSISASWNSKPKDNTLHDFILGVTALSVKTKTKVFIKVEINLFIVSQRDECLERVD